MGTRGETQETERESLTDVNTHRFSSLRTPKLIYYPVWFVCQMADYAL